MINIKWENRKSSVLTVSDLACLSRIPTVNLTAGCAHGCIYCYARGYTIYPGENTIVIYKNLLEKIVKELSRKKRRPKTVYFSPSSDPFQPVPEVLDMTHDVFSFLLGKGIGISFLTKGRIPDKIFRLFEKYNLHVSSGIGLISVNASVLKIFEPKAASADERLENMQTLVKMSVFTQSRIDPILPGVTDSHVEMETLVSKIAATGVRRIAASALFLRPAIRASIQYSADPFASKVLGKFTNCQRLGIHASKSNVAALSQTERQNTYTALNRICMKYGIEMKICACKNPDIAHNSCSIAGLTASASEKAGTYLFPEIRYKEIGDGKRNPH